MKKGRFWLVFNSSGELYNSVRRESNRGLVKLVSCCRETEGLSQVSYYSIGSEKSQRILRLMCGCVYMCMRWQNGAHALLENMILQ